MLTVCTGWSPSGWKEYGRTFAETFAEFWPASVELVAYTEEPVVLPRGECRSVLEIPGCREFLERHRKSSRANGREPTDRWKRSARASGYNWRFDAWKFSRQGFIPLAAALECKTELLCWLDADVVTFKKVPDGFVESLLPAGANVAHLGRTGSHSEIGFQLYRLPAAMNMLRHFRDYYASDSVFGLSEWHSAFVWEQARRESGITSHDLTPGGSGHVWFQSPLCRYMDHLKGSRKQIGRSSQRA